MSDDGKSRSDTALVRVGALPSVVPTDLGWVYEVLGDDVPVLIDPPEDVAIQAIIDSLSPGTWQRYRRAWAEFIHYAASRDLTWMPADPETVRCYLIAMRSGIRNRTGRPPSLSLLEQHAAAIATMHRLEDLPTPTSAARVQQTLGGFRRQLRAQKASPPNRRAPLFRAEINQIVEAIGRTRLPARRDRDVAMILMAARHGLRRSEVAGLRICDLQLRRRGGYVITIPWSKTDQHGVGRLLAYPINPAVPPHLDAVRCLERWLQHLRSAPSVSDDSSVFRAITATGIVRAAGITGQVLSDALQAGAEAAGIDVRRLGGHSLRRGFVTAGIAAGIPEADLMHSTGHRSVEHFRRYREEGAAEREDAAAHTLLLETT